MVGCVHSGFLSLSLSFLISVRGQLKTIRDDSFFFLYFFFLCVVFLFFYYYFYLYWILSYIEMKQPWVYMCSPSRETILAKHPACVRPRGGVGGGVVVIIRAGT